VLDALTGEPLAGAEVDVWQNGEKRLYAVQDPNAPEENLRGRFRTREAVHTRSSRSGPPRIQSPTTAQSARCSLATGRHPWRPAHIYIIVRAEGYQTLITHLFDRKSEYLDSDTVLPSSRR
jgi:hydroxyquinol 1,2-dioxygenase